MTFDNPTALSTALQSANHAAPRLPPIDVASVAKNQYKLLILLSGGPV